MRRGTWLSRAALLEEVELAKSQEMVSSACSHLPLACSGIKNNLRKLQGYGQKEAVAVFAFEWQ